MYVTSRTTGVRQSRISDFAPDNTDVCKSNNSNSTCWCSPQSLYSERVHCCRPLANEINYDENVPSPYGLSRANTTSSTKPGVHSLSSEEDRATAIVNVYRKFRESLDMSFLRYASRQTYRHTNRQTDTIIAILSTPIRVK